MYGYVCWLGWQCRTLGRRGELRPCRVVGFRGFCVAGPILGLMGGWLDERFVLCVMRVECWISTAGRARGVFGEGFEVWTDVQVSAR